jgi:hypothetical protein
MNYGKGEDKYSSVREHLVHGYSGFISKGEETRNKGIGVEGIKIVYQQFVFQHSPSNCG